MLGSDQHQSKVNAEWSALAAHGDEHQVELDVNRSFVYYPEGMKYTTASSS